MVDEIPKLDSSLFHRGLVEKTKRVVAKPDGKERGGTEPDDEPLTEQRAQIKGRKGKGKGGGAPKKDEPDKVETPPPLKADSTDSDDSDEEVGPKVPHIDVIV